MKVEGWSVLFVGRCCLLVVVVWNEEKLIRRIQKRTGRGGFAGRMGGVCVVPGTTGLSLGLEGLPAWQLNWVEWQHSIKGWDRRTAAPSALL